MYKLNFTERKGAKDTCIKVMETMGIKFAAKDLDLFDIVNLDLSDLAFCFLTVISKNHPEMGYEEKHIHALWAVQGFLQLLTDDMNEGEKYVPSFNPSHLFHNWLRISEERNRTTGSKSDESCDTGRSDDRQSTTILGLGRKCH